MTRNETYRTTLFLIVILLVVASGPAGAQSESYVIGQQPFLRLIPLFQHWSIGNDMSFSQLGVGFAAYMPLSQDLGINLQTSHVSTSGDLTSLSSIADAKLSLNYYIEKPGVVLSCGVNLPTGKKGLTQDEFETSLLISNEVFDLQIPNVGQGLTVQPGLAWATSLGDKFSIGAGASYQYRAKYKPLADYGDYDPGDEVLLTAGVDFRLGETSTLAADVVFTAYGTDKLDDEDVFASGSKIAANAQFRKSLGQHELLISTRYRSLSPGQIGFAGTLVPEEENVIPDMFDISARFRLRVNNSLAVAFRADGRFYQQTAKTVSGVNLFGVGLAPEITVSPNIMIPIRAKVQFGRLENGDSLVGTELGLGISVLF
jgi:hypothetical protein